MLFKKNTCSTLKRNVDQIKCFSKKFLVLHCNKNTKNIKRALALSTKFVGLIILFYTKLAFWF